MYTKRVHNLSSHKYRHWKTWFKLTKGVFGIARTATLFTDVAIGAMLEILMLVSYVTEEVDLVFVSKQRHSDAMNRRISPSLSMCARAQQSEILSAGRMYCTS